MSALAPDTEYRSSHKDLKSPFVKVDFVNCPVETSLGVLGKKWTLAIIRDVGAYGVDRFSRLRKSLPGIPPKVLATRLKQLERDGFLRKTVERAVPPKTIRWTLTEKGVDAIRVAMSLAAFGAKWHADRIFEDQRPRSLGEVYSAEGLELYVRERPAAARPASGGSSWGDPSSARAPRASRGSLRRSRGLPDPGPPKDRLPSR